MPPTTRSSYVKPTVNFKWPPDIASTQTTIPTVNARDDSVIFKGGTDTRSVTAIEQETALYLVNDLWNIPEEHPIRCVIEQMSLFPGTLPSLFEMLEMDDSQLALLTYRPMNPSTNRSTHRFASKDKSLQLDVMEFNKISILRNYIRSVALNDGLQSDDYLRPEQVVKEDLKFFGAYHYHFGATAIQNRALYRATFGETTLGVPAAATTPTFTFGGSGTGSGGGTGGAGGGTPRTPMTPVENFRRSLKRNPDNYVKYESVQDWGLVESSWLATAAMEDTLDVLTPSYMPTVGDETDLFELKNTYMYSVMQKFYKTSFAQLVVRKHAFTRNAQRVFEEVQNHAKRSTVGLANIGNIMSYISGTKLGPDSNWKGTTTDFIIHFMEQVRRYHELTQGYPNKALHEDVQKAML